MLSPYRIGVLVAKEMRHGSRNLFFILAIAYPIILSLLVSLVFGDIFDQKPRLGILDEGESQVTMLLAEQSQLDTRFFEDEAALRNAAEIGVVSVGIVIPADFDTALTSAAGADMTRYVWNEAPGDDQLVISSALQRAYVDVAEVELPISLESNQLGEANVLTWTQRLLPLLIVATIVMGGMLLPAAALVDEKVNRTLIGLTVTPTTLLEVYISKAIVGIVISVVMAVVVLVINDAFGNNGPLLVMVLAFGSIAASIFGVLLGTFVKSVNGLLAVTKALGFVLFLPGILAIFPEVPAWISQIFPTYYIMNPVIEVSQNNASLGDIGGQIAILAAITGAMIIYLVTVFERQQQRLTLDL